MGIARGPNLIKDNLVFGYDTGYGVADVFTTTRFYKGKPVDNMATDPTFLNSTAGTFSSQAWGGDTGNGEFATNTSPEGGGLMYINNNTSTAAGGGGNYNDLDVNNWTLTNGVTYTRSWWAKSNITQTINGHMLSVNGGGNNTYILGGTTDLVAGEWKRVSHTFTYTLGTSTNWRFRSINYNQSKVYIANIQLEVGSNASPFTATSRSGTASLIDLTRTRNIDISGAGFDSTGQIEFDGTNDSISCGTGILSGTGDFTVEAVFKYAGTGNAGTIFANYQTGNLQMFYSPRFIGLYLANSSAYLGSSPWSPTLPEFTNTDNVYMVTQREGTVTRVYLNGVLAKTGSSSSTIGTSSASFRIGSNTNQTEDFQGNIYVVKAYDRALTSTEIKQNFNAYKNRFNL
tara:strand:- start:66 stop:1268 length:1203 start_codon:yes stop_codon:yes gene_type:complete